MSSNPRKTPHRSASNPKGANSGTMDQYIEEKGSGTGKKEPNKPGVQTTMATHEVTADATLKSSDEQHSEDLRSFITEVSRKQTNEICAKIDGITSRVSDLENSVELNSVRIMDLETKAGKYDSAVKELQILKDTILLSEVYSRKSNLLVYGIPEHENRDLTRATKGIFSRILKIEQSTVDSMQFVNIHRLPAQHKKSHRPDPVIMKFVCQRDRDMVFNARFESFKALSQEKIVIRTDLPPVLKQRRAKLEAKAYTIRKERNYQTLQYRKSKDNPWKPLELNETLADE